MNTLTIEEAASRLNIGETTVRKYIRKGDIKVEKELISTPTGYRYLIPAASMPLLEALARPKTPSRQPSAAQSSTSQDKIVYPFPLKSGEVALIHMPKNVTQSDVLRLAKFLESIVVESSHEKSL